MRSGEEREDILYRFPYSRVAVEPVPDISGTFATRLLWQRGKATVPLFESTALRPIAQVQLRGQNFPVFLSQHSRKRRERILLAGKRKTARSPRCALRFIAIVEGRDDRLTWTWRVGATSAALAIAPPATPGGKAPADDVGDEVSLFFPLSPGRARLLDQPDLPDMLGVWVNDLVVTLRPLPAQGVREGAPAIPILAGDSKCLTLTLANADLSGHGVTLGWETWVAPARTHAEALAALYRHAAEARDRYQEARPISDGMLLDIGNDSIVGLADASVPTAKRGIERLVYKERGTDDIERQVVGEGTDTALLCVALLCRFYQTGDDALRRRARLLSYGVADFQVSDEESPHWGAIWDAYQQASRQNKGFVDIAGGKTFSVATVARASLGLFIAYEHFKVELLHRAALSAAQWLLLKLDRDARIGAERFREDGPPVEESPSAFWIASQAMLPLVKTFQVTENEAFLKAALRIANSLREAWTGGLMTFDRAPTTLLCAAIEGVLAISREYENPELIAFATQLSIGLRARRDSEGFLSEPPGLSPLASHLAPTLSAVHTALILAQGETEPFWLPFALRAVCAARRQQGSYGPVRLCDHGAFHQASLGVLLAIAARAKNCVANFDRCTVTRGWQTFAPDPATRAFVRVATPDGGPVDYLALVCPVSLQVLIAVCAPPTVTEVLIEKNQRRPYVKNLLNGDVDVTAALIPLGDGQEANIGLFQADT